MNSLVLDLSAVLFEDIFDFLVDRGAPQVLLTGKKSVVLSDGGNTSRGSLIDARDCESCVNVLAELGVAEEALRIIRLILLGESLELIVRKLEVHGGKD